MPRGVRKEKTVIDKKEYPVEDIREDITGEPLHYLSDPQLRSAETKIEISNEHIKEIHKCKNDIIYFAENYIYITDPDKGRVKIKLRSYQKKMLKSYMKNRFCITLASRQIGKSVTTSIFIVWYSCFRTDKKSVVLANKATTAREIFSNVVGMFRLLPHYIKPGVYEYNKSSVKLDNGCSIQTASSGRESVRGLTVNGILFIDEAAFIDSFDEFYTATYNTVVSAKESKIIMVSTPNGMNHYYRFWQDAIKKRNEYFPIKIKWTDVPGRNEKWKKQTIANTSEEQFAQEHELEFLGGMDGVFPSMHLKKLVYADPVKRLYDDKFAMYEKPIEGFRYVIGVDTAEGVGRDYSVIQVMKITEKQLVQVGTYHSNTIEMNRFANIVNDIGKLYFDALVLIEYNAQGVYIGNTLHEDLEYENIFSEFGKPGIRLQSNNKKIGVSTFRDYLVNDGISIVDFETIKDMTNYIHYNNSYRAKKGTNDDCVSALVLLFYATTTKRYKEYADINMDLALYEEKNKQKLYENMLPFYVSDGFKIINSDDYKGEYAPPHFEKDLNSYFDNYGLDDFSGF